MNAADFPHCGPLARADAACGHAAMAHRAAQPAFAALAWAATFPGRVLVAGCGTGEHTVLAAQHGLDVTGIDLNEAVLHCAEPKLAQLGLTAFPAHRRSPAHRARRRAGAAASAVHTFCLTPRTYVAWRPGRPGCQVASGLSQSRVACLGSSPR
jgi:SAM-dependent methyltransferase